VGGRKIEVKNGSGGGGGGVASSEWGGVRLGRRAAATQAMRCCQNPRHSGTSTLVIGHILQMASIK